MRHSLEKLVLGYILLGVSAATLARFLNDSNSRSACLAAISIMYSRNFLEFRATLPINPGG
jgi:hypothetical protein